MLKLVKINKYFNKRRKNEIHIINNVNLEFKDKGLVAILGCSGSGKTTLLNTIGGLDKVNNGKIYINGKKIINVELFIYYNLAFFTILLIFYLIKNNILNFKYIENLIQYITVYETILMYIILFLMSRLIAKNVSKNIFKETVISSFNREV